MQLALDRPETPTRRRFDVAAYYRMAETGILSPKDRVELIDGEIIEMAPIGSAHGGKVNRLTSLVARLAADGRVIASVQSPLRLDPYNEPQPDLMLLRPRADFYESATPPPPTCCSWSRSPTARSPTTAAPSSPSTPTTACRRCGSSTCSAARSSSAASPLRTAMPSRRSHRGHGDADAVPGLAIDVETLLA